MPTRKTKRRAPRYRRRRKKQMRKVPLALKAHNFVERVEDSIALNSSTLDANGNLSTNYSKNFQLADIPQVNH